MRAGNIILAERVLAGQERLPGALRAEAVFAAQREIAFSCNYGPGETEPTAERNALRVDWEQRIAAAAARLPAATDCAPLGYFYLKSDGSGWDGPNGRLPVALKWRLDHLPSYARLINRLAHKTAFNREPFLDLMRSCLAVPRIDTEVPWQGVEAAAALCRLHRMRADSFPMAEVLTETLHDLERVLDAYAERDPARADRCLCLKAAFQNRAGQTEVGAKTLAELPREKWVKAVEWSCAVSLNHVADPVNSPDKAGKPAKPKQR